MNLLSFRALVLAFLFIAVVLGVEVAVRSTVTRRAQRSGINKRLGAIERGRTYGETMAVLRRSVSSVPEGLPAIADRIARKLERKILQAHIDIPVPLALLCIVALPVGIFVLLLLLMLFLWHMDISVGRIFISAVIAYILGSAFPLAIVNFKANAMRKRVQDQFPVALDVFVRGLRAGHPVASALELLTVELADPIGSEFGLVVDEVTYGSQLRDALQGMADRWDLDDMRMFVVSLSVQSETGGNLAEILENLSRVIRERQSMALKVRALSSEGRMTALMLTLLPLFAISMLFIMNPRFFLDVADDPWFVPGFAFLIILYLTGIVTIRRMIDLKV